MTTPTPTSTPSTSPSSLTMEDLQRSAQKSLSRTSSPRRSQSTPSSSSTLVPESSQPKSKKAPSLRRPQSVVTIIIGPEESKETFIIHKDIICHYSPFFSAAFTGTFLEGNTQTMTLPDIDSDTFGLLVHWFYTQKIDIDPQDRDDNILALAKLWMLAERCLIPKLQNRIMDGLRPLIQGTEGENLKKFLRYAYEEGKGREQLRMLSADRMAWTTSASGLRVWITGGHLPEQILLDILESLKRDHVHGVVACRQFGDLGEAREYYVGSGEKRGGVKEES